jgi:hypothetical protein
MGWKACCKFGLLALLSIHETECRLNLLVIVTGWRDAARGDVGPYQAGTQVLASLTTYQVHLSGHHLRGDGPAGNAGLHVSVIDSGVDISAADIRPGL